MKRIFRILANQESGQDLVEYSLLLCFLALTSAGLFIKSGSDINQVWSSANKVLSRAASSVPGGHHHGEGD